MIFTSLCISSPQYYQSTATSAQPSAIPIVANTNPQPQVAQVAAVQTVNEGQTVKCTKGNPDGGVFFRFTNGKLSYYSTPEIASSWKSTWANDYITLDCGLYQVGAPMIKAPFEGQSVVCSKGGTQGAIFRFTQNILRGYSSHDNYISWSPDTTNVVTADCTIFFIGCNVEHK